MTLNIILLFELNILLEIGNIYGNYIAGLLFYVIWSIYSSDRMKRLIRTFKDYDKNIVFSDYQMHYFKLFGGEEMSSCCFSSVNLLNFLPKSTVVGLLLRH